MRSKVCASLVLAAGLLLLASGEHFVSIEVRCDARFQPQWPAAGSLPPAAAAGCGQVQPPCAGCAECQVPKSDWQTSFWAFPAQQPQLPRYVSTMEEGAGLFPVCGLLFTAAVLTLLRC
jgi:hypothetical protein